MNKTSFYQGIEAATGQFLPGEFPLTEVDDINDIMQKSVEAFNKYQSVTPHQKAQFLNAAAAEIEALEDELVNRVMAESGLPKARVIAERGRTVNQLRIFASLVERGEWVEAAIDLPLPNRVPVPKPDLRKQLEPVGPVVVFGASNFPLAYSAAGGDTAAALAAGCAVVVKAHTAHPGSSQLVANAVIKAARDTGMPENIYQHVHDTGFAIGSALVTHPLAKSVAFTGSLNGGRALFDLAAKRKEPIPVFAEMGSINPVLLLPDSLKNDAIKWGTTYAKSITLGCGQFCTNPGLLIGIASPDLEQFVDVLGKELAQVSSQLMLHEGISSAFNNGKHSLIEEGVIEVVYNKEEENKRLGGPCLARVNAADFLAHEALHQELFGPYSLLVVCADKAEMQTVISHIEGQLTGTIIASEKDAAYFNEVITTLKNRVGRIIFNGVPTGVEVCTAMQHGGPYPATTDGRFTAVGPESIKRFARPVCYQDWPDTLLPKALKNENPLGIFRKIDGKLTNDAVELIA